MLKTLHQSNARKQSQKSVMFLTAESVYARSILQCLIQKHELVYFLNTYYLPNHTKHTCEIYENRQLKRRFNWKSYPIPNNRIILLTTLPLQYLLPIVIFSLQGVYAVNKSKRRVNFFVGDNIARTLAGLFLKKLGLVEKVIFWASDWEPYTGGIEKKVHSTYCHITDRLCAKRSDIVWNFTDAISNARRQTWTHPFEIHKQIIVPPFPFSLRPICATKQTRRSIVFIGRPRGTQGFPIMIEAISKLVKKYDDIKLEIIGSSHYLSQVSDLIKNAGLTEHVIFHGYVPPEQIPTVIQGALCGIALFPGGSKNMSNYTWPSKILHYLEAGLPVIVNGDSSVADLFKKEKLGIITCCNAQDVSEAIESLIKNEALWGCLHNNVLNFLSSMNSCKRFNEFFDL